MEKMGQKPCPSNDHDKVFYVIFKKNILTIICLIGCLKEGSYSISERIVGVPFHHY